jgi:hypothetical protein
VRRARRRVAPLAKRDAIRVAAVDDHFFNRARDASRASTFDIGAIDRETRNARRGD